MKLSLAALLLSTACSRGADPVMVATRVDSAGVEIISNSGPAWRSSEGWRIDAEPILQIGHPSDDEQSHHREADGREQVNHTSISGSSDDRFSEPHTSSGRRRRSARIITGNPNTAGRVQKAIGGSSRHSGRCGPLST
jgi:hypothetical protein